MKKKLHFLLSMVVLTLLSVSGAKAQDAISSWDFQGYGSTVWLPVNTEAEGIVIFDDRTVYPSTEAKFEGIYAEADKIRIDKNTGIRAYTKGGKDVIGIAGLKKGDVIEVACNAGGGTGTDQVILAVTDNATLAVNSWDDFSITMNEDGNLGIEPIFYNTNGNWYSIATINVTHPEPAPQYLANPSFELSALDTPLAEEIIKKNEAPTIYGWTMEGVGTQYSNTEVRKANTETVSTSQFGTSNPSDGEYSLFYRNGWNAGGTSVTLTSDAITELPAGDYLLSVDYKQRYAYDEDNQKNENTKVAIALNNGETVIASEKSEAAGGDKGGNANTYFNDTEWSTLSVPFSLETSLEGAQVVITLNAAGARRSDFYIDNVQLVKVPGIELVLPVLDKAIKAAKAEADKYIVGEGLFQYAESEIVPLTEAISEAQAAYDAAESKDAVQAAIEALNAAVAEFAPVYNTPDADKAYILSLTTSEGTFQLSTEGGIKIAEEGTPIYFVAQDGGTYALSPNEGEYINYTGTGDNIWSLGSVPQAYGWTIAAIGDGKYTITGKNGFLGTNTSDGNAVGSPCYGDKKASNGNYIWTIEEVAEPEPELVYVDLTSEMFHVWDGIGADAQIKDEQPYFENHIGESAGTIYGNGNVEQYQYADLTDYATLVLTVTEGTPRLLMNVEGAADPKTYLEIKEVNDYASLDGDVWTIDLAKITAEYGYAHLNVIKGANWANATITSAKLGKIGTGDDEPEIAGTSYAGIIEQTLTMPTGEPMGKETADQTVTIAESGEGLVNITFSGFKFPVMPTTLPEFTIENVAAETAADGSISYAKEGAQLSITLETGMIVNYNATLEGVQADADATPVLKLVLQQSTTNTVYFGADQAAIDAYKAAEDAGDDDNPGDDEPEIAGTTYEGVLVENGQHAQAGDIGTATEAQTVTIADPVDGVTSITFSGINYVGTTVPMPVTIPEFTIDNVTVVENADGTTSYYCEEVVVAVPMGAMTVNYVGALQGLKVSADATPVLVVVLANSVKLTIAFAATADEAQTALGVAVGVNNVKVDAVKADGKYFEDGKVVIYRNGVKYGVNGAAVK